MTYSPPPPSGVADVDRALLVVCAGVFLVLYGLFRAQKSNQLARRALREERNRRIDAEDRHPHIDGALERLHVAASERDAIRGERDALRTIVSRLTGELEAERDLRPAGPPAEPVEPVDDKPGDE